MRKAKYNMRQVICRNASCIGYSSNVARPGYWVAFKGGDGQPCIGRVLARIDHAEYGHDAEPCRGYLAVIRLFMECTHAGIAWVNPDDVTACYEKPPAALLAWMTGEEWAKNPRDVARIIAMAQHGTLSESFITTRDDPEKPYNSRAAQYNGQFIIGGLP